MPVYFIKASPSGYIKIGYSVNPVSRLISLQESHGEKLQLLRVIKGDRHLEGFFHHICKSAHIRGEWYRPTKQVLKIIKSGYEISPLKFKNFPDISAIDIIKLRMQLGLTQAKFAKRLGVNQATVSKWENGGAISRLACKSLDWWLKKMNFKQEAA